MTQKAHFVDPFKRIETFCGKRINFLNPKSPKNLTTSVDEVTCSFCIKKLKNDETYGPIFEKYSKR